jgi:hypothetical protein
MRFLWALCLAMAVVDRRRWVFATRRRIQIDKGLKQ